MKFGTVMAVLLLLAGPAALAQSGEVTTASALRRSADPGAPVVVWLKAGTRVTVVGRDGGWLRVRTTAEPPAEGWIRMFDVRLAGSGGGDGEGGALSRLFGLFRGEPE
ncbi:MAG: SH3 domain-containing protein, partial [Gammaproteobacteria bacterium]